MQHHPIPCEWCGKPFIPTRHRRRFCSKHCAATYRGTHSFKTGRTLRDGYVMLRKPDHPAADMNGVIREHRWVMEQILGRFLGPDEVVHHINGQKADNRPENLAVMSAAAHHALHNRGEGCANAKLTTAQVLEMRQRAAQGERQADLAREFGISSAQINRIVHRKDWRHI